MKVLYFDCFSGISGNMALGALLELGVEQTYLEEELRKVKVDGYHIEVSKVKKNGIGATYVDVVLEDEEKPLHHEEHGIEYHEHHDHEPYEDHDYEHNEEHEHHDHVHNEGHNYAHLASGEHHHDHTHHHHIEHHHDHDHHHHHRTYSDIINIIEESGITEGAKKLAKAIFYRIAKAEAKVHQETIDEVHFHEVGAIDSIVDIIGTAILIDKIAPHKIIASVVHDGYGFAHCQHGRIPIPVPATVEIFADANVRSKQIDIPKELVTPTGAAIIAELATEFTPMPEMMVKMTGYGAGKRDLEIPNVLRVVQGVLSDPVETESSKEYITDEIVVLNTNIDDCSPEVLGYTMECLFEAGAKDVFFTPIQMKKNRMATMLTVLCDETLQKALETIIFRETTTIGIRSHKESRTMLPRQTSTISTQYGELKIKEIIRNGVTTIVPEYESAKELARKNNIAIQKIYRQIDKCNYLYDRFLIYI